MTFFTELNDQSAEKITGGAKAPKHQGAWVTAYEDPTLKDWVKVSYEGEESYVPFSGVKFTEEGALDFENGKLYSLAKDGYEILEVVGDEVALYTAS